MSNTPEQTRKPGDLIDDADGFALQTTAAPLTPAVPAVERARTASPQRLNPRQSAGDTALESGDPERLRESLMSAGSGRPARSA